MPRALPRKAWFALLLLLVVLMILSLFAFLRDAEARKVLTAELPANIKKTDVRRTSDPETGQERSVDVIVTFEYEFDGQKQEGETRLSRTESLVFIPWGKAKICYDPADRKSIEKPQLFPPTHQCGE